MFTKVVDLDTYIKKLKRTLNIDRRVSLTLFR